MSHIKQTILGTVLMTAFSLPVIAHAETAVPTNDQKPHAHKERMFDKIDADKSGGISLEEFQAKSAERFKAMDTNNDGILTKDEMDAAHANRKDKMMKNKMREKPAEAPAVDGAVTPAE